MKGTARELKIYEYRVKATPEFVYPIEEGWEVIDVYIKHLSNGCVNYVLVFRREDKGEDKSG